jgi:nicotinamidase-related amidase
MNNQTALLIIDIQNDYFEGGTNPLSGSLQASLNAKKILDGFRAKHMPVIHIQHISTRPGSTFFLPGTFGADIHLHVQPWDNEKVIEKHFPNSFRETGLHSILTENQIRNLVICGMMTHMCVDASVRAAKDYGFNCTLISDACATKNLEIQGQSVKAADVHNSFLAALGYFYASVKTASELLETSE